MKEIRFKQLWDTVIAAPRAEQAVDDCDTNGMSATLAASIVKAEAQGESLALTDWTEMDF